MKTTSKVCLVIASTYLLTACGGGGGGGGGGLSATLAPLSRPVIQYTGGNITRPNTVYTASTTQQPFSFNYTGTPENENLNVSNVATFLPNNGEIDLGLDGSSTLDYIRIKSSSNNVDFSLSKLSGDTFTASNSGNVTFFGAYNSSETKSVLFGGSSDYNYQAFGWWMELTSNSGIGATFTTGALTNPANIPTSGSASYSGFSTGLYTTAGGDLYITGSRISASAFFSPFLNLDPRVSLTSSDTNGVNINTDIQTPLNQLNFSGSLPINFTNSSFTGNVSSADNSWTGSSSGVFYGPALEEIGGTFRLSNGTANYIGSFGAKK